MYMVSQACHLSTETNSNAPTDICCDACIIIAPVNKPIISKENSCNYHYCLRSSLPFDTISTLHPESRAAAFMLAWLSTSCPQPYPVPCCRGQTLDQIRLPLKLITAAAAVVVWELKSGATAQ
jgi:hypothetical protein